MMSHKQVFGVSAIAGLPLGAAVASAVVREFRGSPGMGGLPGAFMLLGAGGVLLIMAIATFALAWEGRYRRFFLAVSGGSLGALLGLALMLAWA
jgi:hypothetical protein